MTLSKEVEVLFNRLAQAREKGYIGEAISQLEHALQSAKIAADGNGSDALILAALFHDIGHICASQEAPTMDAYGIDNHHGLGAAYLRSLGFSDTVATLVQGHVDAKRYLVAKNPNYHSALSVASQETLRRQGGPMSKEEMHKFEEDPLFKEMLQIRACDDRAKQVDWEVPALESYYHIAERHLASTHSHSH